MRTKIMINESDDIKQEKTSSINSPSASPAQSDSSINTNPLLQSIKDQNEQGLLSAPFSNNSQEAIALVFMRADEKVFRFIYFSYILGYSPQRIADGLNEVNGTGDKEWSSWTVFRIIKNEQLKKYLVNQKI